MSRSGYSCDLDTWDLIRWRGAVKSALRGSRGQEFLKELLSALDAMPVKELIAHDLVSNGCHCTLGVIGAARGLEMTAIDPEDANCISKEFGIAKAMAKEIVYENDEGSCFMETPAQRWKRMREWVSSMINDDPSGENKAPEPMTREQEAREANLRG